VVGTWSQLPPFMPVEHFVDVIHGNVLPKGFSKRGMKLLGREQIPGFCLCKVLGKERTFFFERHQPPAPTATTFPVET